MTVLLQQYCYVGKYRLYQLHEILSGKLRKSSCHGQMSPFDCHGPVLFNTYFIYLFILFSTRKNKYFKEQRINKYKIYFSKAQKNMKIQKSHTI